MLNAPLSSALCLLPIDKCPEIGDDTMKRRNCAAYVVTLCNIITSYLYRFKVREKCSVNLSIR